MYSLILLFILQFQNRGKANYCFDYNPVDEHVVAGQRVILYPCHGMGQNQVLDVKIHGRLYITVIK